MIDGQQINFALETRCELAKYKVMREIDMAQAYKHYDQALDHAASAYACGQHNSVLLKDYADIVLDGRYKKEAKEFKPLATSFLYWMEPLINLVPEKDVSSLAKRFDNMSIREWCEAGDRASVIDSAFKCAPLNKACNDAFGVFWPNFQMEIYDHTTAFSEEARSRVEWERVDKWVRRYVNEGVGAAIFAFAELVLGVQEGGYWLPYVFEINEETTKAATAGCGGGIPIVNPETYLEQGRQR